MGDPEWERNFERRYLITFIIFKNRSICRRIITLLLAISFISKRYKNRREKKKRDQGEAWSGFLEREARLESRNRRGGGGGVVREEGIPSNGRPPCFLEQRRTPYSLTPPPCGELEERNKGVEKSPVCNYWLEFLLPRPTPYRPVLAVCLLPVSPSLPLLRSPSETRRNLFDINLNRGVDIDRILFDSRIDRFQTFVQHVRIFLFKCVYNIFFLQYLPLVLFLFVLNNWK